MEETKDCNKNLIRLANLTEKWLGQQSGLPECNEAIEILEKFFLNLTSQTNVA